MDYTKNKNIFLIATVLQFLLVAVSIGNAYTDETIHLDYSFTEPILTSDGNYDKVSISDLESYIILGEPVLPVKTIKILLPHRKLLLPDPVK